MGRLSEMSLDFFKFRGSFLKWDLDFSAGYSRSVFEFFSNSCVVLGIRYPPHERHEENDDICYGSMNRDPLLFVRNQDCTNLGGFSSWA